MDLVFLLPALELDHSLVARDHCPQDVDFGQSLLVLVQDLSDERCGDELLFWATDHLPFPAKIVVARHLHDLLRRSLGDQIFDDLIGCSYDNLLPVLALRPSCRSLLKWLFMGNLFIGFLGITADCDDVFGLFLAVNNYHRIVLFLVHAFFPRSI